MHGAGCVYVNVAMRARDQSSIFSTGGKFCPDYGLLLELHALTLVARSYALLICIPHQESWAFVFAMYNLGFVQTIGVLNANAHTTDRHN